MDRAIKPQLESLGDPGEVLFTLAAARENQIRIEKELFDTYLFLLKQDGVLRFSYPFRFQPLPVSDLLHEDLYNLTQAGFVKSSSPIGITDRGVGWLKEKVAWSEVSGDLRRVGACLASFARSSRRELSAAVYSRITRPIPR